jgi:predicted O-methyltransferase YrrM
VLTLDGAASHAQRGQAERAVGFIKPYVIGAASAAYLFTIGWVSKRNRAAIVELSDRLGYRHNARVAASLPRIAVAEVFPEETLVDIREPQAADGNVTELELILLARIARGVQARSVFEFGTFDGRTTLNLAANSVGDATVYTLDLPASLLAQARGLDNEETKFVEKPVSGARFLDTPFASRITQLYGNSANHDFTPYYDSIDLVFVDASHAYDYVINDSLHALRMLRSGHGTIVWHDYGRWDGVTSALNDLRMRHESFANLQAVEGTTLALLSL